MQLAFYSVVIVCSAGIVASVGVNELIPLSATFANFSAKKLHVSWKMIIILHELGSIFSKKRYFFTQLFGKINFKHDNIGPWLKLKDSWQMIRDDVCRVGDTTAASRPSTCPACPCPTPSPPCSLFWRGCPLQTDFRPRQVCSIFMFLLANFDPREFLSRV
jgi:hypothetical protein